MVVSYVIHFDCVYNIINDEEKRNVVTALIKEIEIYRNDESEYFKAGLRVGEGQELVLLLHLLQNGRKLFVRFAALAGHPPARTAPAAVGFFRGQPLICGRGIGGGGLPGFCAPRAGGGAKQQRRQQ